MIVGRYVDLYDMLKLLLEEKNMSLYRLEKSSHVSHATLNDLYNERTNVEKCTVSFLSKLAVALHISLDRLYNILCYKDLSLVKYNDAFDLFKSNVCQELVSLTDKSFLKKHLEEDSVSKLYDNNKKLESLYLLSMIDYLSNRYNLPLVKQYEEIRRYKMRNLYVSKSIYLLLKNKQEKISNLFNEAIKEFLNHNILEANIYDVR